MRYLFLIYGDEKRLDYSPEALAPWARFNEVVAQKNLFAAALQETATATTIRVRKGKRLLIDGPFAETKEQLGGFYLLNCQDLDEAIDIAAQIPAAVEGSIEIRPLMEFRNGTEGTEGN